MERNTIIKSGDAKHNYAIRSSKHQTSRGFIDRCPGDRSKWLVKMFGKNVEKFNSLSSAINSVINS